MNRRLGAAGIRRGLRAPTGAPASAPFSPADITGLEAWYRETYAAGTWSDLSGNGRDLTQATDTARPTQVTRAGQLALSFGGSDYVRAAFGSLKAQPLTIYAVFEPTTLSAIQYVYDGDDTTNRVALLTLTTPAWGYLAATLRSGGTPTMAIHAAATVANGANSGLFIDDLRDGQAVITTSPGTAGIDGLTVGAANTNGQPWTGYIWEILVYSGAHTAAQRKQIGDYFTARYPGLTVTT